MRKRSGPKIKSCETPVRTGFFDEAGNSEQPFEIYLIDSFQEDHKVPQRNS